MMDKMSPAEEEKPFAAAAAVAEEEEEEERDKGKQLVVVSSGGADSQAGRDQYPEALAKYEDVVEDRKLFLDTLGKLHSKMGTKFMVPTVGGKELDLHRLFVEVTSRGGIERVIRERRWREIIAAFNFPSTATNASFVLRKYYMSLIYHYEQIYFFELRGWSTPSNASLNPPSVSSVSSKRPESVLPCLETQSASQRRRKSNGDFASSGLSLPMNCPVVGVIDGKYEHGYFVTVTVGKTKLKGILYHPPDQDGGQAALHPNIANNSTIKVARRRRRRKKLSKRDPTHPKPNRSGYNFFFAEQHARLKPLHPGKDREISKMIGELWNKLTESDKAVYQEKGVKDKERYRSEMEVYRQKLKTGQVISNAVPIQQRPAESEITVRGLDLKMEMDEDDLPMINHDDSSTDCSESEGKKSDTDSELETSQEMAGTAAESISLAADLSTEGDAYELRRRDEVDVKNELDLPSSSEDVKSKKLDELTDKP